MGVCAMRRAAGSLLLGAVLATSQAAAGVMTLETDVHSGRTSTIPQFDPSLGTLTGIEFDFRWFLSGYGSVSIQRYPATGSVGFDLTLHRSLDAPGMHVDFDSHLGWGMEVYPGMPHLSTWPIYPQELAIPSARVAADDLRSYVGVGLVSIAGVSWGSVDDVSPGTTVALFAPGWQGFVSATYTYAAASPVPEPSSLVLAGVGAALLTIAAWARSRSRA